MSQHRSYLNLPTSRRSDWLDGSAGMGKRTDGFPKPCPWKRSNLHSYEIGVALREKKEGRESESIEREGEGERQKAEGLSNLQCVHICMLRVFISTDHFMTYNAVLTDSSLW